MSDFDTYLFADESGHIQTDRHFLVGVLRIPGDWETYEAEVESVCRANKYAREIKYSKSDVLSLPAKKAIIDWVMESDFFFRCLVKDLQLVDWSHYTPRQNQTGISKEELFFNHTYKTVVRQCLQPGKHSALLMDHKSRREGDNCLSYMGTMHPNCRFVGEADSKRYRLLQVVDLLTGCVNGDLNGAKNAVKRETIAHFKSRMGVNSLGGTCYHPRANVWHWRPPITK